MKIAGRNCFLGAVIRNDSIYKAVMKLGSDNSLFIKISGMFSCMSSKSSKNVI